MTVVPVASEDGLAIARLGRGQSSDRRHALRTDGSPTSGCRTPAGGGYTYFTRYYYAQQDKEGAIIDERYNQGGQVADYIVNELDRKLMGYLRTARRQDRHVADRGNLRPEGA